MFKKRAVFDIPPKSQTVLEVHIKYGTLFQQVKKEKHGSQWRGAKARVYSFGSAAYDFDDLDWEEIDIK